MQVIFVILFFWAIVYFWPWLLIGFVSVWALKRFVFWVPDPHIGYVILKDGMGKFGITRKNGNSHELAVKKRYSYRPLRILWTGEFKDRRAAYNFEDYCKNFVKEIVRGREWTTKREAQALAWNLRHSVRWSWVPRSGYPPIDKPDDL